MELPRKARFVVLGGGVHGLSTAYHLALATGAGDEVVVLEKNRIAGGASGIACGVVRNFYFSAPMAEVIRVSVELFESDPEGFGYHPVGYIAAVPEVQAEDCVAIQARQAEIGYRSDVTLGEERCREHMRAIFPDWNGDGIEAVLHERQGGWAQVRTTVENLARLAREQGVRIFEGVEVTGLDLHGGEVRTVETDAGAIDTEVFVAGPGPWAGHVWRLLDLPAEVEVAGKGPTPIATYWKLQEGDYWLDDGVDLRGDAARSRPSSTSTTSSRSAPTATAMCSSTARGGSTTRPAAAASASRAAASRSRSAPRSSSSRTRSARTRSSATTSATTSPPGSRGRTDASAAAAASGAASPTAASAPSRPTTTRSSTSSARTPTS